MHSKGDQIAVACLAARTDRCNAAVQDYLQQVKKGEKKIASAALKPHELVQEAMG